MQQAKPFAVSGYSTCTELTIETFGHLLVHRRPCIWVHLGTRWTTLMMRNRLERLSRMLNTTLSPKTPVGG